MNKILFSILFVIFFSFSFFAQTVTKEEYEIYAVVLRKIYRDNLKNDGGTAFVILDKTKIFDSFVTTNKITNRDFNKKNQTSVKLTPSFPIKYQYWVVEKDKISQLLEMGDSDWVKIKEERKSNNLPPYFSADSVIWKYFYENFPKAYGYYELSRIGFSSNKKFAKVNVEMSSAESGFTTAYILKKNGLRWIIYSSSGSGWIE